MNERCQNEDLVFRGPEWYRHESWTDEIEEEHLMYQLEPIFVR
jgi:hypothetical protein